MTSIDPQSAHAPYQREKFAKIPALDSRGTRKLTLLVEDRAGVVFLSSHDFPELMVVVKDRNSILPALDESLGVLLGDANCGVGVYMNCQRSGSTVDVIVELRPRMDK